MKQNTLRASIIICLFAVYACNNSKPSKDEKIIKSAGKMNDAVGVQMLELLTKSYDSTNSEGGTKLSNPFAIKSLLNETYKPAFTDKMKFTAAADKLLQFINNDAKYFGLLPKSYQPQKLQEIKAALEKDDTSKNNAVRWATAEVQYTDALFQIAKHIKNGHLYIDTNDKHNDTTLNKKVFAPLMQKFAASPDSLKNFLTEMEPNFADFDSLKNYLKQKLDNPEAEKKYTILEYNTKDSAAFVTNFIKRVQEEGFAKGMEKPDTTAWSNLIKEYQKSHDMTETGIVSKEMVDKMNKSTTSSIARILLTLDKFRGKKINNEGAYVLVNIPAYTLRAFKENAAQMESKVAVGKVASKTPIMESEISEIIIMPQWIVPPSILKLPGYIARKRNNPNYRVVGNRVIQKSGPGNALGNMKFNFKSGNAIYLHDTNEKWAFGSSKRAVSHGCVRVQDYVKLASFITSVSDLSEKNYKRVVDQTKVDSVSHDTTFTYKSVVVDSVLHKGDVVPNMVKHKAHQELTVEKKVPIYINYFTCAVRNGVLVTYDDIYGIDKALESKYITPLM